MQHSDFFILVSVAVICFGSIDKISGNSPPLKIHINGTSVPSKLSRFLLEAQTALYHWHPLISSRLSSPNYTAPPLIYLNFENCAKYSAASHNFGPFGRITACTPHYLAHPTDIGSLITVLTFIIQNYNIEPRPAHYVTYGVAQYVRRYMYEKEEEKKVLKKPGPTSKFDEHSTSSDDLAYFFNYINLKFKMEEENEEMDFIQLLNWDSREGKFNSSFWEDRLGKDVHQLWAEMVKEDNSLN